MTVSLSKKNWIFLFFCIAITVIGKIFSPISALSSQGNTALFFMISLVLLIATETLPAGLVGIIGVVFLPILGLVKSLAVASQLFGNQLFFYIIACYAIAAIMGKLPLSKRILFFFLKNFGKTTKGTITAIWVTTAILSTFISNFPCIMLVYTIAKQYVDMIDDEKERIQTQKSLMIGLIIGGIAGGLVTPIGNSMMVLASTYLQNAGYPINFLQWMCFGLPVGACLLIIGRYLLFKFLPPVEQDEETRKNFLKKVEAQIPEKFSIQEILTIVILGVTVTCWVLNFNLIIVTCCCGIALLFPGFTLMSWDEFNLKSGWGTIIMVCSLVAVVTVLQNVGVISWLLDIFKALLPVNASVTVLILIFGFFTILLMLLMPNGPALVVVLSGVIIALAESINVNPAVMLLGYAFFTSFSFTIPIDVQSMVIYQSGKNFAAKDMAIVGFPLVVIITIITAIWLPICGKLLEIM